jgi:hypothetical protein
MLMYAISLILHTTMAMTIHNQCSDIELTSPMYFCSHGTHYEQPVERTCVGTTMKIGFRFDPNRDEFGGILVYEMQKKEIMRSDHQSSIDAIYAKTIEETSKAMRLLVTWKIKRFGEFKVDIVLVEYDNKSVMSKDRLAQLYDKIDVMPFNHDPPYNCTWLVSDNAVLTVTYEIMRKESLELKVTMSKGIKNLNIIRPMWIDSTR